jgi:hypothetical protein
MHTMDPGAPMSLCDRPFINDVGSMTHGLGAPMSLCVRPTRQSLGDNNV